jgi:hypothetical protein
MGALVSLEQELPSISALNFCGTHMPAIERDQAGHNVMLAALRAMADGRLENVTTWTLGGVPGQCATMPPSAGARRANRTDGRFPVGPRSSWRRAAYGGEEDAAPIRMESLSDYQLEMLIKRLQRG